MWHLADFTGCKIHFIHHKCHIICDKCDIQCTPSIQYWDNLSSQCQCTYKQVVIVRIWFLNFKDTHSYVFADSDENQTGKNGQEEEKH